MENKSAAENVLPTAAQQSVGQRFSRVGNPGIHHTNYRTYIRIPGFKYDDFDRTGNIDIVKCCRLMQITRVLKFPWLQLADDSKDGVVIVVLGNHHDVSRRLYERAAIDYPMRLTWWLAAVGRSSIDIAKELRDESTGELLVSNVMRGVYANLNTHKPVPLPDAVRRQVSTEFSEETGRRFPTFRLDPNAMPPSSATFSCTLRVRFDDTDQLDHTTQSAYTAFMRECASQAAAAGFFTLVTGDFAFYSVQSLTSVHTGESFAGDELQVTTWEDADNALLLYFVVTKNAQTLCYARMLLFERIHSKM